MKTIPRDGLNDCLDAPDPYLLVEVLGEAAFDAHHLPYAINVPLGRDFADRLADVAAEPERSSPKAEPERSGASLVGRFLVRRLVKRYVPGLKLYLAARDLMKAVALQRDDATAPSTRGWAWTAVAGSTLAATFVPFLAPVGGVVGAAASHVRDARTGAED
jgi:hypothetical protein